MKTFNFKINGNRYEVLIDNLEEDLAHIQVNGMDYTVELEKKSTVVKTPKLVRTVAVPSTDSSEATVKTSSPSAPKGGGTIQSPLPGVILKLHVKVGDTVQLSQELITLEAMKMENEIQAATSGIVVAVNVTKGDAVTPDEALLEIQPE